jgi:hypothetical protein
VFAFVQRRRTSSPSGMETCRSLKLLYWNNTVVVLIAVITRDIFVFLSFCCLLTVNRDN